ncbi:unnamed protein product [Urochloa humidicola]
MASRETGGGGAAAGRPALRVGRTREFRTGMDTELLSIDDAAVSLFVLCGDRFEAAQLFRSGALSLHMLRVEAHPVSMASCTVGDHQWMLARDALVARVDARAFVFELPGFFYAVVVSPDAAAADRKCATMADIFSRFCSYHDLTKALEGDDDDEESSEVNQNPWARAHARIQRLKRHAASPPGHAAADAQADRARQMERAVRTSAVVKLLTRSLLAGVIQPARHLTIASAGGGAANAGTSSTRASAAALPSKSVVSDLLDAIETNRAAAPRRDARRGGAVGWWSLNVEGIMLLLRVVQAVRGRKHLAAAPAAAGQKRPRDEGPAGRDGVRGGVLGGGGGAAAAFGGGAARRWCGGRPRKLGNTVGACGSS